MTAVTHEIEFICDTAFHGELPPRHVGYFLTAIQPAARAAVAMAFSSRSKAAGKIPEWLRAASDIRFLGFTGNGATRLQFAAPQLGRAAQKLYEQQELFPSRPSVDDTAFDLLADTLTDVAAGDESSERFDRPLLRKIAGFKPVFSGPFSGLTIYGARRPPVPLSPAVIQIARRLSASTPPSRRVRVVGKLDAISDSRQAFELLLDDGVRVRGVLLGRPMGELANLFRKRVLIYGNAHFRPSGQLLRLDGDDFREATESDRHFAKAPEPIGKRRLRFAAADRERMARGLQSVIGQWPGDETDEQFETALREIG